jgi:hypothetical protein
MPVAVTEADSIVVDQFLDSTTACCRCLDPVTCPDESARSGRSVDAAPWVVDDSAVGGDHASPGSP